MPTGKETKWISRNIGNIFDLVAIIILLLVLLAAVPLMIPFNDMDPLLSINLIISIIVALGVYWIILKLSKIFKGMEWFNTVVKITIGIMIISLVVGGVIIHHYLGNPEISFVLRNSTNLEQVVGNITCSNKEYKEGRLIIDSEIHCEFYPDLDRVTGEVIFKLNNGSVLKRDFSEQKFIAPSNSNYILFRISGFYDNDEFTELEVGYPIRFYTDQEYRERNDAYITYLIFLLAAVLFSVPSMMNNFKNLAERNSRNRSIKRKTRRR